MENVNKLLAIAIKETDNIYEGEHFLVKDLFKGYEWNRIYRRDRILLGKLFIKHVNTTNANIKVIHKTSLGQQRYLKGGGKNNLDSL